MTYSTETEAKTATDGTYWCRWIVTPGPDFGGEWIGGNYDLTQFQDDKEHGRISVQSGPWPLSTDQMTQLLMTGRITFKSPSKPFMVDLRLEYYRKGDGARMTATWDQFKCS